MPLAVDQRRLSLASFLDESEFPINRDRTLIEGEYAQFDAVQLERVEGVREDEPGRLGAQAPIPPARW